MSLLLKKVMGICATVLVLTSCTKQSGSKTLDSSLESPSESSVQLISSNQILKNTVTERAVISNTTSGD